MKIRTLSTRDPARRIQYWFDRDCRSWVVRVIDTRGNQIGDAYYCGTKTGCDLEIKCQLEQHW